MVNGNFLKQNRYSLTLLLVELCTLVILFFVLAPALIDSTWFWKHRLSAAKDQQSLEDVSQRVKLLTDENLHLKAQIDSLQKTDLNLNDDDSRLSFLRKTASQQNVSISNVHIDPSLPGSQKPSEHFAINLRGRYHDLGEFTNKVERSFFRFRVVSLSLRGSLPGGGLLEGRIELVAE